MLAGRAMVDNRSTWDRPHLARRYSAEEGLQPAEAAALALIAEAVRGRPILDLGVGAGRTTPALRALSTDYVGVDYAAVMVAACRKRFPGVDFRCADAQSLEGFADGRFALAMFSFNGIDYVGHEGRLRILAGLHRVLAPGGWLLFSSHNRAAKLRRPWNTGLPGSGGVELVRALAGWFVGLGRHLMRSAGERRTSTYEIVNDDGENFRLMTYRIGVAEQRAQIVAQGFDLAATFDRAGQSIGPGDTAAASPWVYYLCRKPRARAPSSFDGR